MLARFVALIVSPDGSYDRGTTIQDGTSRDGVVTAIVAALSLAASKDPRALSRCVEALGLALGALVDQGEDEGRETG